MIVAQQLSAVVGGVTLLQQVNLSVAPGELLMVLGPNGAGKSTLLQALAGSIKVTQGSIELSGQPLSHYAVRERAKRLACLSQQLAMEFDFTVQEVVALGRYSYGESKAEAQSAINRALIKVDMESFITRRYRSLSGGEQQRVHLARVFAQIDGVDATSSRYLLLDEHVAHLDLAHQQHIFQVLRNLLREKVGIVAVVHDLNLALAYADRVVLLHHGKAVAEGKPQEVLTIERMGQVFEVAVEWAVCPQGRKWMVPKIK